MVEELVRPLQAEYKCYNSFSSMLTAPPNTLVTLTVRRCFVLFLLVGLDKELS